MRKLLISAVVAGLVLVAAPARAAVPRTYAGETSQGRSLKVWFHKKSDGSLRLNEIYLRRLDLVCSIDGSTERWGIVWGWGPGGFPLDGRTLTLDEIDGEFAFHLHAKVKATTIVGSLLRFSHASFTSDEEPQICTTGDLTWTATRTVPAPARVKRTPAGSTFVRKIGGATITFTRLR